MNAVAGIMPLPWRRMQWLAVASLLTLLYWPVLAEWGFDLWDDPNYSHGLLIPLVFAYLIRKKIPLLATVNSVPSSAGLFIVLPALLLFLLGHTAGELFSQRISFILLLIGLVVYFEGISTAKILAMPLVTLFFAVPLPYVLYNSIAFPLQLLATSFAAILLDIIGLPVFVDGNIIILPHATLEVVDACSGIRSLMTMLTLAFFFSYFSLRKTWKRVLLISLAIPLTVMTNSLRVAAAGWLTHFDQTWSQGGKHEFTGWLAFVVSFCILIFLGSFLKEK